MKDARWFRHDSNARNDQKLIMIRAKHGAAGYGAYFMIIEILRDSVGYKIPANQMLEPSLALATGCQPDFMKQLLSDCFDYGLLVNDGEHVWSDSLMRRMDDYAELCEKNRNAGRLGGLAKASARQANAKQTLSYREDVEEKKERSKETGCGAALPPEFVLFWSKYPNKVAKPAAVKAWKKILPLEAQALLIAVDKQKADREEKAARKEFVPNWPNPATWLNQRRWEDEIGAPTKPAMDEEERRGKEQAARLRAEYRAATGESK